MNVFKIILTDLGRNGKRMWVNLETDCEGVSDLMRRFEDDKLVYGHRLFTRADPEERGVLEVTGSQEVIVGREAVYMAEVPNHRFVRYQNGDD